MSIGSLGTLPVAPRGPGLAAVTPPGGPPSRSRPSWQKRRAFRLCNTPARENARSGSPLCRLPRPASGRMRKVLVTVFITGSLASAAAWSPRDAISAVCVAWERPWVLRGSPTAAEAPKALPEENVSEGRGRGVVQMLSGAPEESKVFSEESVPAGRGRGLVQMLSGAVLLFLIGGMPFLLAARSSCLSFVYRDLLVPDDEEDEQPLTARQLRDIFEQFSRFDAGAAKCDVKSDRQMLLGVIESSLGSVESFNSMVRKIFTRAPSAEAGRESTFAEDSIQIGIPTSSKGQSVGSQPEAFLL